MKEVSPQRLLLDSKKPRKLQLDAVYASELCEPFRLKLMGEDVKLASVQKLTSALGACPDYSLSFFSSRAFAHLLDGIHNCAILTKPELGEIVVSSGNSALIVDDPKSAFFSILAHLIDTHRFEMLSAYRHPSAQVAPSASIADHVYLDKGVIIGEHVRIFANTYVGENCIVQSGAVVGNSGFEPVVFNGRRQFPAHAGGVWLSPDSTVGTNTCIDKGYFGEFTFIGQCTFVGSFIHMAHSVSVGAGSEIGSAAQIAGFCEIGENVGIGPHATVLQNTKIGSNCTVGAGSLVLRDLPAHTMVQGFASTVVGG